MKFKYSIKASDIIWDRESDVNPLPNDQDLVVECDPDDIVTEAVKVLEGMFPGIILELDVDIIKVNQ